MTNTSSNNTSTSSIEFQRKLRTVKLDQLQALGINPFPVESKRDYKLLELKNNFESIKLKQIEITIVGRIKTKRDSGKISFITLEDESLPAGFQIVLKKDELPEPQSEENNKTSTNGKLTYKGLEKLVEVGDYIQISGYLDITIAGENSLFAREVKLLTKSLRPLPDKLEYENIEARYLDRVADFKMNTVDENGLSVRDVVKLKSKYWSIWREEMLRENFMEAINPTLELLPGGAECKPFVTHYNELDQDVYLRIALELPLKKLIAGGFERVFEIGRVFRNESGSPMHLQEFTFIEWYCAYTDYIWAAKFVKKIFQRIVLEVTGSYEQIDYYSNKINWNNWCSKEEANKNGWELLEVDKNGYGWPKINYFDAVRHFSNGKIDTENKTDEELYQMCLDNGINDVEVNFGTATLLDKLWKKARLNTVNPFFLINPPVELEPLAKRDTTNPHLVQRWQVVAGRAEHGKAFSELNDPIDQFGRFEKQQEARDNGNEEAQFMDMNYVKAMEYGMPPMSGFGISDRFLSSLLGKNIRDIEIFPHIRSTETTKNKITLVNHAIVLQDLELWRQVNAYSHLSASLGARTGKGLFTFEHLKTIDNQKVNMNIGSAIINKIVTTSDELKELKTKAEELNLSVEIFTEEMQETTDDRKIKEIYDNKSFDKIKVLGILIHGKKSTVESLTNHLLNFGSDIINTKNKNIKSETLEANVDNLHSIDPDEIVNHFGNNTILEYWLDSYKFNSTAKLLSQNQDERGSYLVLDKTIFYPQGGGQPSDTGIIKLDEQNYFTVEKCLKEDGIVRHYGQLTGQIDSDSELALAVDQDKRVTNINLHSVAHLIDYAIDKLGMKVVGGKGYSFPEGPYCEYHLSEDSNISLDDLQSKLEIETNRLRELNLNFKVIYTKTPEGDIIRNVQIDSGQSTCPCAGTHIKNTSEFTGRIIIREAKIKKGVLKVKYQVENKPLIN